MCNARYSSKGALVDGRAPFGLILVMLPVQQPLSTMIRVEEQSAVKMYVCLIYTIAGASIAFCSLVTVVKTCLTHRSVYMLFNKSPLS